MRIHLILRYMGMVLLLNAAFMLISAGISAFGGDQIDTGFYPLVLSSILTMVLGSFPLIFVNSKHQINNKESYVIVVGSWLLSCLVGTFPYLLWGGEFGFINSWFESVSGFTTTGATILNNVEALPKGLLFWRSTTHWLGGVGVVMFTLIILPAIGRAKSSLSSVELSTLAKDNYRYRAQKTIQILLLVYVGMTLAETVLLKIAGMSWFDAINHAFSTIATGGFSTKNMSIAYYNNIWIEIIIFVFMVLSGLHFGLIFTTIIGSRNNIFRSEVARFYLLGLLFGGLIIAYNLFRTGVYPDFLSSIRYSLFQLASVVTTTGFATCDANLWGSFAIMLTIFFMFQCSCAGSTAGGIKCDRVLLAFKIIAANIKGQQHPNAIITIRLNGATRTKQETNYALIFIVSYVLIVLAGTIFCAAYNIDLLTSFTLSLSCVSNIGPGFGEVGSLDNYSAIPDGVKSFSTLLMLLGRLEIFGLVQLFIIKWWR